MGVDWMRLNVPWILTRALAVPAARRPRLRTPRAATTRLVCATALLAVAATGARAQGGDPRPGPATPTRTATDTLVDSLLVRLQRAEEAIALLTQQLAAQASSATQTESRARFDIGGRVIVNAFRNSGRVNNTDVPQFARPDTNAPGRLLRGGVGAAIRQTTVSGTAFVPRVLGGTFTGDMEVDFYGGQQASPGGRHFPILRIRTARGTLRWSGAEAGAEVMVGQDVPLVAPIEPVSLAAIGVPEFGTAGNLWLWLPQLRVGVESRGALRVGLTGAVLAPTNGDPAGLFDTGVDQAERSRRPVFESRLHARWGPEDEGGEVGVGVHKGWLAAANDDALVDSEAIVAGALVPFGWVELRGEVFTGKALRGLGGGGIAQGVTAGGVPIRTRGGWGQVHARWRGFVTVGGGCGWDTPDQDDLPATTPQTVGTVRLRNNVCEGHVIARPDGPIVAGLTLRRTRTNYRAPVGVVTNQHLNLTLGYQF